MAKAQYSPELTAAYNQVTAAAAETDPDSHTSTAKRDIDFYYMGATALSVLHTKAGDPDKLDVRQSPLDKTPADLEPKSLGIVRAALGLVGVKYSLRMLVVERPDGGATEVDTLHIDWRFGWFTNRTASNLSSKWWARGAATRVLSDAAKGVSARSKVAAQS